MEGEQKVCLRRFGADQKIASSQKKKKRKKSVLGHPKARATSYCLFPDTL